MVPRRFGLFRWDRETGDRVLREGAAQLRPWLRRLQEAYERERAKSGKKPAKAAGRAKGDAVLVNGR